MTSNNLKWFFHFALLSLAFCNPIINKVGRDQGKAQTFLSSLAITFESICEKLDMPGSNIKQLLDEDFFYLEWEKVVNGGELVPSAERRAPKWYFYNSAEILAESQKIQPYYLCFINQKN